MAGHPWTEEQTTELKDLALMNLSAGEIGDKMGVTRNTVIGKLARIGVPLRGAMPKTKIGLVPRARKPKVRDFDPSHFRRRGSSIAPTPIQRSSVLIDPLYISLIDLESYQCHWPLDHKGQDGLETFCGHTKFGEYSYCYAHCCVGYQKFACGPGEVLEAAE
jgi:hypothetical protein